MEKRKYYSRKFLNQKQGIAAIECELYSWKHENGFTAHVKISDCNRTATLDFSAYNTKELAQVRTKLFTLIQELEKFEAHLNKNYDLYNEGMKAREARLRKKDATNKDITDLLHDL